MGKRNWFTFSRMTRNRFLFPSDRRIVRHRGFTLIEISLFLAVTAALFIGIALGMNNSVFRQRYEDSTQSFLEFLRSIYSEVSNPQSPGQGNSAYAIYGKLIVFGETTDILGEAIDVSQEQQIFTYDVIGLADSTYTLSTGSAAKLLGELGANVVFINRNASGTVQSVTLSSPEKYEPRWSAQIENPNHTRVQKSILVVRHPRSGTINTLIYDGTIEVNSLAATANVSCRNRGGVCSISTMLTQYLNNNRFQAGEIDFCVNPYVLGESGSTPRQNIRVLANARNASSVQMIEMDGGDNRCKD